jgi:hypothetical protein
MNSPVEDATPASSPVVAPMVKVVVRYMMNEELATVQQCWNEYSVGIGGKPSLMALTRDYKAKWRNWDKQIDGKKKSNSQGQRYLRRMKLIKAITERRDKRKETAALSCTFFEKKRQEENWSLDTLQKAIGNKKFSWA